jgi:hypothetical protein
MSFDRIGSIRSISVPLLTRHAGELEPLFREYGFPCAREAGPERATLVSGPGADRRKLDEILVGYEEAKGP